MPSTVSIYDTIKPLADEWEQLAQDTKASPFLWPGWFSAWWQEFGAGRLHILTVYENGHLTGVLPLRRSRGVLTSVANPHTPLFGFLTANQTVAKQLSEGLFSQNPRRIVLSRLSSTDAGMFLTRAAAERAGYRVLTESVPAAPYVAVDGTTWDAYESGLRRKFRSELRRRRRRLEEEGELTLELFDGTERLSALLEEGFRIEGSGWKGTYGTSINSQLSARRFYTEVARWASERGWLRLAFLRLNGRALAFDYCLEYNKTHYLLKTGYDPAYGKFAPGMIIRHLMLARAFSEEEIATYDFLGLGWDYAWKREWTDAVQERVFLHMTAPTLLGSVDRAAFVGSSLAVEQAKRLVRSSAFPQRGRRILRRGYQMVQTRLSR